MSIQDLICEEDLDKVQKHFLEIGEGKSSSLSPGVMIKSGLCILVSMTSVPL